MKEVFAFAALAVSLGANIPYIRDIVRGNTKPERISWLIWTILGAVYFGSAILDSGATLFTFGEVTAPVVIFLLSLKYGVGGRSRFDLVSLLVASVAFALLFILDGVLVGLLLALFIDSIGITLTVRKVLRDPTSELQIFWLMGIVSSTLALLSLKEYTLEAVLFPVYVFIVSSLISFLSHPGKAHPDRIKDL